METKQFAGYLPDERPPALKLFLYALQQVIVMFPATIAVALITGFQVSTTIFASGIATVAFVFITGGKIPMYYGSSFAYLTAVMSLVTSEAIMAKMSPEAVAQVAAWAAGESPVMPDGGDPVRTVRHHHVRLRVHRGGPHRQVCWP